MFKIKHSRIENWGQKWMMRIFMAKKQLFFEIKLPLPLAKKINEELYPNSWEVIISNDHPVTKQ